MERNNKLSQAYLVNLMDLPSEWLKALGSQFFSSHVVLVAVLETLIDMVMRAKGSEAQE